MVKKKKVKAAAAAPWTTYKDGETTEVMVEEYVRVKRRHGYVVNGNAYLVEDVEKADVYECPNCEELYEDATDAAECHGPER